MVEVSYCDSTLKIGDNKIELDHKIQDFLVVEDVVVVLEEPPYESKYERNIVAFDKSGSQIWRVESPSRDYGSPQQYNYIRYKNKKLIADNWNRYKYIIDVDTGEIEEDKRYLK